MNKDRNPGGGASHLDDISGAFRAENVEQANFLERVNALRGKVFEDPSNVLTAEMDLRYGAKLEYKRRASDPQIWSMHITYQDGGALSSSSFGVQYVNGEAGEVEAFSKRETAVMGEESISQNQNGEDSVSAIEQEMDLLLEPFPPFVNQSQEVIGALNSISDAFFEEDYGHEALEKRKAERRALREKELEEQAPLLAEVDRLKSKINILNPDSYIQKAKIQLTNGIEVNYGGGYDRHPENWYYEIYLIDPRDRKKAVNFSLSYDGNTRGGHPDGLVFGPSAHVYPISLDYFGHWSHSGEFRTRYPEGIESVPQIEAMIDYISAETPVKQIGNKEVAVDTHEENNIEEIDLNKEVNALKDRIFSDTTYLRSGEIELMNGVKIKYKKNPLTPQFWSIHIISAGNGSIIDMEFGVRESSKTGEYVPYSLREEKTADHRREVFELAGTQSIPVIKNDLDKLLVERPKDKPKHKKGKDLSMSKRALIPEVYRLQDRTKVLNPNLDVHQADLFFHSLITANYYAARGIYDDWGYRFELPNPDGSVNRYFFDFGYDYSLGFNDDIKLSRGAYVIVGTRNDCSGEAIKKGKKAIPVVDELLDRVFSDNTNLPQIPALIR